jgi:hypothetical protein
MENQLVQQSQGTFLDKAMGSLVDMQSAAKMILDSQLAPNHFYEKGPNGKPDYTKGLVPAVVLVCVHGYDLGMKPLVALQHIIPVNGLLSIKGDAAKSLIFNSGKLKPGTWKEVITGTLEGDDYACTITAQRSDTLEILSRSFSIAQAKRAGLWVTQSQINGQDGWKYQKSAWFKYPQRMLAYRALGFLARDLFPDVLSGTYTTEEAMDMPVDTEMHIPTGSGAQAVIPDRNFSQQRSDNLTTKANDLIDKRNKNFDKEEPAQERSTPSNLISLIRNGVESGIPKLSEKEIDKRGTADLLALVELDDEMVLAMDVIKGRNTHKKLKLILLDRFDGTLQEKLDDYKTWKPEEEDPNIRETAPPLTPMEDQEVPFDELPLEEVKEELTEAERDVTDPPVEAKDSSETNPFGIEVGENTGGRRPFDEVKLLYEEISTIAGVDNNMFASIIENKLPQFQQYKNKEEFCYAASKSEINTLLNSI